MPEDRSFARPQSSGLPEVPQRLHSALSTFDPADSASLTNVRRAISAYVRTLRGAGLSVVSVTAVVEDIVRGAMPRRATRSTSRVETTVLIRRFVSWAHIAYHGAD